MSFTAEVANGFNGPILVTREAPGRIALTVSAGNANDGRVVATAHIDNDQAMQLIEALGTAVFGREVAFASIDPLGQWTAEGRELRRRLMLPVIGTPEAK